MKRLKPEISTGSMADIAFLLLVFFLVATTMDIDSGLARKLPPYDPDPKIPEINKRNILNIRINSKDEIMVNNEVCDLNKIKSKVYKFILNPENEVNKPDKEIKNIPLIGNIEVSKGIISLQNDRGTSYKTYVEVLNELTATGNRLKNELSYEKFHKLYDDLTQYQQRVINMARPFIISEADPVFIE